MVKEVKIERKKNPFMPVIGLLLAFVVAIIAYFASPYAVNLAENVYESQTNQNFDRRLGANPGSLEAERRRDQLEIAFAVLIWFTVYAVLMFVLAAAIGEDPATEERLVTPRLGDKKATKKFFKEQDKLQARRAKRAEELKRKNKQR